LRDEFWRLRGQENVPTSNEERRREAMVLALQEELNEKNTELAAMKGKFESIVYCNPICARFSCREAGASLMLNSCLASDNNAMY
jgi:hypothetical protein